MADTAAAFWDPLNSDHFRDPYPAYREYRKNYPVFRAQTGEFIISRYDDVKMVLKDKSKFVVGNRMNWISRVSAYAAKKDIDLSTIPKTLQSFIFFKNLPDQF